MGRPSRKRKTDKAGPVRRSGKSPSRRRSRRKQRTLGELFPDYGVRQFSKKVKIQKEGFIAELREAYLHQGLVLYLGAGVSQSLGLPSWPDLVRALTVRMMSEKVRSAAMTLKGYSEEEWFEVLIPLQAKIEKSTTADKPILMMARAIKDELGARLPALISRSLYGRFLRNLMFRRWALSKEAGRERRPLPSSKLLEALVALARAEREARGVQAIVNYNYDDLVDEKLREGKVRCVTVRSGQVPVPPGSLPCYHVHGVLPVSGRALFGSRVKREIGNFVFSEDEYHTEYADPYRWSNLTQISLLGRYVGLFVGLSMEDPNIRRLVDVTHKQYPEVTHYAILTRRKAVQKLPYSRHSVLQNLYEEVETSSFKKIGIRVIWVDDYDEIPVLLGRICLSNGPSVSPAKSFV